MLETIKGIIGDIATGAIKDQRIQLSEEELVALDRKLHDALHENSTIRAENERLTQRVSELEQLVADRDAQIQQLRQRPDELDPKAAEILKRFFEAPDDLSAERIARQCSLERVAPLFRQSSCA